MTHFLTCTLFSIFFLMITLLTCLSPFLFVLAVDELTRHIQGEVPWCMLCANDILMDETCICVNNRLEVWRHITWSLNVSG